MQKTIHLFGGFFQLGYVVRDLEQAIAGYQTGFGATEFLTFVPPDLPDGSRPPTRRIALAYIDEVMIELIEVAPEQPAIYGHAIPDDPSAIVLHHLGFFVSDHEATLAQLEVSGFKTDMVGTAPGMLDYIYADTRAATGLYSEYIHLHAGGEAFFGSIPRNKSTKA
jgi:hypothetical protein